MSGIHFDASGRAAFSIGILFGMTTALVGFLAHRCIRRWWQHRTVEYDLAPTQERSIERVNILSEAIFKRHQLWQFAHPFLDQGSKISIDRMERELECQPGDMVSKMAAIDFTGKEEVPLAVLKRFVRKTRLSRPTVEKLAPNFGKLLIAIMAEPKTQMTKYSLETDFPERPALTLTQSRDIRMRSSLQ